MSGRPDAVVVARGLRKHFFGAAGLRDLFRGHLRGRRIDALRGIDLEVAAGEIVGVLGPNGAGKSTLLKLMAGLLLPDAGELRVLGQAVEQTDHRFRRRVSYVAADERSFSWRLTGKQNLEFFAALHGLRGRGAAHRVDQALERVGLQGEADRPVREYSTGTRQRLAFARGLLGDPEIFLFDEPSRAIDPRRAKGLRRFIREELLTGRTAIVATHDLIEVEQLCTRVAVVERGCVMGGGAPHEARRLLGVESAA